MEFIETRSTRNIPAVTFATNKPKRTNRTNMAQLTTVEKVLLTANPTTAATTTNPGGVPAPLDGDPIWEFEGANDSGAILEPVPGTLTAWLISGDTPGTGAVKVSGDADIEGEGEVRLISQIEPFTVTAAEAAGMNVLSGTPEPK